MAKKLSKNTLYYDTKCSLCSRFVSILTFLFPISIKSAYSQLETEKLMKNDYTWVYVDKDGKEHYRSSVIGNLLFLRKITYPLGRIITTSSINSLSNTLYTLLAKNRHGLCSISFFKNKKNIPALSALTLTLLFLLFVYTNRFTIYEKVGHTFFATPVIGSISFYNISIAEKAFTLANEKVPPAIWVNYQLSRINFIKGDYQRALFFVDQELELHPSNCRSHYIRGLTYGYIERLEEAISDFLIFNKCFPDTWAGVNDISWFYFRKGDIDKAITTIEASISKNNNALSPWLQNTYGVALMNKKRYGEAEQAFRMALYIANNMKEEDWGKAYPGNNPIIYGEGLESMRTTIENNITLLLQKNKGGSYLPEQLK